MHKLFCRAFFSAYYVTFDHNPALMVFICLFCLDFIVFIVVGYKYNLLLNNLYEKMMEKECLNVPILAFSGYFIPLGAFCVCLIKHPFSLRGVRIKVDIYI